MLELDKIFEEISKIFASPYMLIISMSSFIIFVFLIGVFYWLEARRLLRLEEQDLDILKDNLLGMPEGTVNDPRLKLNREHGIVRQRVDTIMDLKERNGRLERESLAEASESRLTEKNTQIRYIAGALILFGLFGTLCGLVVAVGGLQETLSLKPDAVIERADAIEGFLNKLEGKLGTAFSGMQTAFTASLFGVGTTIILTFLLSVLTKRQDAFLADFEETTSRYLAPIYFPQEQTQSLDQFATAMKDSSRLLDRISRKIKTDVNKSEQSFNQLTTLVTGFNQFTENFQVSNEAVQGKLIDHINQLGTVIERMDESSGKSIETANNMAALSKETLTGVTSSMEQFRKDMTENANVFKTHTSDFFDRVLKGVFMESLKSFAGAVKLMKEVNDELLSSVRNLQEQQLKSTNAVIQVQNYFHEEDRLGQVRDAIVESTTQVGNRVEETIKFEREQVDGIKSLREIMVREAEDQAEVVNLTRKILELQQNGHPRPQQGFMENSKTLELLKEIAQQTKSLNQTLKESDKEIHINIKKGLDTERALEVLLLPFQLLASLFQRLIIKPIDGFIRWSKPESRGKPKSRKKETEYYDQKQSKTAKPPRETTKAEEKSDEQKTKK